MGDEFKVGDIVMHINDNVHKLIGYCYVSRIYEESLNSPEIISQKTNHSYIFGKNDVKKVNLE